MHLDVIHSANKQQLVTFPPYAYLPSPGLSTRSAPTSDAYYGRAYVTQHQCRGPTSGWVCLGTLPPPHVDLVRPSRRPVVMNC